MTSIDRSILGATESPVFDYRSTEFILLALGIVMTVVAFGVGVWLYRAALREHHAQIGRERRERESAARGGGPDAERGA